MKIDEHLNNLNHFAPCFRYIVPLPVKDCFGRQIILTRSSEWTFYYFFQSDCVFQSGNGMSVLLPDRHARYNNPDTASLFFNASSMSRARGESEARWSGARNKSRSALGELCFGVQSRFLQLSRGISTESEFGGSQLR
jgi:hypothetical protein